MNSRLCSAGSLVPPGNTLHINRDSTTHTLQRWPHSTTSQTDKQNKHREPRDSSEVALLVLKDGSSRKFKCLPVLPRKEAYCDEDRKQFTIDNISG